MIIDSTELLKCIKEKDDLIRALRLSTEELHKEISKLQKTSTWYRLYPNGTVWHQDEFNECDENYDDYGTYLVPDDLLEMVLMGKSGELPDELVAHILDAAKEGESFVATDRNIEWVECVDNNLFDHLSDKLR